MPPKKQNVLGADKLDNLTYTEAFKELTGTIEIYKFLGGKTEMDEDSFSYFITDILKLS